MTHDPRTLHDAAAAAGLRRPARLEPASSPTSQTAPSTSSTPPRRKSVRILPGMLGFLLGIGTVTGLAIAGMMPLKYLPGQPKPAPQSPDPRVAEILSLIRAERSCDEACLADLQQRADLAATSAEQMNVLEGKAAALEQALNGLQQSKAAAETRAAELEQAKIELQEQMDQRVTELEQAHADMVGKLEQRLAELESSRTRRASNKPAKKPQPAKTQVAAPTPSKASGHPWNIVGMSHNTVVVATRDNRIVALAPGESADGITIRKIDLEQGRVETTAGTMAYRQ